MKAFDVALNKVLFFLVVFIVFGVMISAIIVNGREERKRSEESKPPAFPCNKENVKLAVNTDVYQYHRPNNFVCVSMGGDTYKWYRVYPGPKPEEEK